MKKLNPIDELFKEGLGEPEISFNEDHWLAMEQRLDVKKKKKIIPLWLGVISGVAAALILVLFWLTPNQMPVGQKATLETKVKTTPSDGISSATKTGIHNSAEVTGNDALKGQAPIQMFSKRRAAHAFPSGVSLNSDQPALDSAKIMIAQLPVLTDSVVVFSSSVISPVLENATDPLADNRKAIENERPIALKKSRLVLSILAAPDLSSVSSSGRGGELGINIGAQATIQLSAKFSVTSGISYSKKYYNASFSLYQPDKPYITTGNISNVAADCNVLDIPINVNYRVFEKRGNSIILSSGLSSYIMLKERYSLNYVATASTPEWQREMVINNQNQHFLGIANLGITFQHQINRRFSVSAQPFLKLPLTDIGYGNIRLQSSGMALSVNMNILKPVKSKTVKEFKKTRYK